MQYSFCFSKIGSVVMQNYLFIETALMVLEHVNFLFLRTVAKTLQLFLGGSSYSRLEEWRFSNYFYYGMTYFSLFSRNPYILVLILLPESHFCFKIHVAILLYRQLIISKNLDFL